MEAWLREPSDDELGNRAGVVMGQTLIVRKGRPLTLTIRYPSPPFNHSYSGAPTWPPRPPMKPTLKESPGRCVHGGQRRGQSLPRPLVLFDPGFYPARDYPAVKVRQPVESCSGIMLTGKSLLLCNAIVTIGF